MGRFAGDPDYALHWPVVIARDELQRLIIRGERDGMTTQWRDEVERLLQQAFSSTVPSEDFTHLNSQAVSQYDEEPF